MSFTSTDSKSLNYISCYFLLTPRYLSVSNNNIFGDISGPFSINEIQNNIDPNFIQLPGTIIRNKTGQSKNYIVGIPRYNGNNVSTKKIYSAMTLYNINFLSNIVPYKKLAGNDTTVPENLEDCTTQTFSSNGNVQELNRIENTGIVNRLNIANRICLRNTRFS